MPQSVQGAGGTTTATTANPKVCLAALLATDFHRPDIWAEWIKQAGNPPLVVNSYTGNYTGEIPAAKVTDVPTTWEQTLAGQLALIESALKIEGWEHLVLISESCIPVAGPDKWCRLKPGISYFTGWKKLNGGAEKNKGKHGRIVPKELWPYFHYHEQWWALSRAHCRLLLDNKADALRLFKDCFADNEEWAGTMIAKLEGMGNISAQGTVDVVWRGGPHPATHREVNSAVLQRCARSGALTCRKINAYTSYPNGLPFIEGPVKSKEYRLLIHLHNERPEIAQKLAAMVCAAAPGATLVETESTAFPAGDWAAFAHISAVASEYDYVLKLTTPPDWHPDWWLKCAHPLIAGLHQAMHRLGGTYAYAGAKQAFIMHEGGTLPLQKKLASFAGVNGAAPSDKTRFVSAGMVLMRSLLAQQYHQHYKDYRWNSPKENEAMERYFFTFATAKKHLFLPL